MYKLNKNVHNHFSTVKFELNKQKIIHFFLNSLRRTIFKFHFKFAKGNCLIFILKEKCNDSDIQKFFYKPEMLKIYISCKLFILFIAITILQRSTDLGKNNYI